MVAARPTDETRDAYHFANVQPILNRLLCSGKASPGGCLTVRPRDASLKQAGQVGLAVQTATERSDASAIPSQICGSRWSADRQSRLHRQICSHHVGGPMKALPSIDDLAAVWRLLVVRSGIVLALGVVALPWPIATVVGVLIILATIALLGALFDAAIAGALHNRIATSWLLLPEAILGVLLGGAVLLYPIVPLGMVAVILSLWMVARGALLIAVARGAPTDALIRVLASGWIVASVLAPLAVLVHWSDVSLGTILQTLVAYVLVWSAAELAVGLHLRGRARRLVGHG